MSAGPEERGELPEGEEKRRTVRGLFDTISPRYDLVNRVMTFGMDVGWRRRAVSELRLPGRAAVADLACGTGDLCRELSRRGYRAIGFDFSLGMLVNARTDASAGRSRHPAVAHRGSLDGRGHVRLRLAQRRVAGRPVRRARSRGAARRPDRASRHQHARQRRDASGTRALLQPRGPDDRRPASPIETPTPTFPSRWPTSRLRRDRRACSCRRGSPTLAGNSCRVG